MARRWCACGRVWRNGPNAREAHTMDALSLIGLVLAVLAVTGGAVLKGAGLKALVSMAAFMIVIVGTVAAICVQTPLDVMKRAFALLPWVVKPPRINGERLIAKLVDWSQIARKQGLLGLESIMEREHNPFLRKGLQMVVDGNEPDT